MPKLSVKKRSTKRKIQKDCEEREVTWTHSWNEWRLVFNTTLLFAVWAIFDNFLDKYLTLEDSLEYHMQFTIVALFSLYLLIRKWLKRLMLCIFKCMK